MILSNFSPKIPSKLPRVCGVYLMRDTSGDLLYIGKAKNIRKRVESYFSKREYERRQIPHLVEKIHKIDWIATDNESEALILEANLIRKYKPPYNIDLKDDKRYPFLEITVKEKYPRLIISRRPGKGAVCFGPYTDVAAMRKLASFSRKLFKIRTCKKILKYTGCRRPCLNYSIRQCGAPCAGKITQKHYLENVSLLKKFISGKNNELIKVLKKQMAMASDKLDFEEAASLRDQINMIKNSRFFQSVDLVSNKSSVDVFGFFSNTDRTCVCVNSFRKGFLISKLSYIITGTLEELKAENPEMMIINFYEKNYSVVPSEIIIPFSFQINMEALAVFFKRTTGKNVKITKPIRGRKTRLVSMAEKNAEINLTNREKMTNARNCDIRSLKTALNLPRLPRIIDAFDISNLLNTHPVAGIVRFTDGKPDRDQYRGYKIKSIKQQNDFAMIEEAVSRRLKNLQKEKNPLPDLIIIDGGKAQLSSALRAVKNHNKSISVISIAKINELIFLPRKETPVKLDSANPGKKLVQRIRDEVHRKAVTFHRNIRKKQYSRSMLEDIKGVGPEKSAILLRHFGSIKKVSEASADKISAISGFSDSLAKKILKKLDV